jgi:DNA primase catalytic core
MGVHKLTAGDGYTYLTRQVAVHDRTDRGHRGLADYYAEKGESPGRWFGSGLAGLGLSAGSEVTEAQMRNLFGEGRHPYAERLEDAALDAGASVAVAKKASQLGRVFAVYRGNQPEFIQETARRYTAYNLEHGLHWSTPVPALVRARIRSDLVEEMFLHEHGRAPLDDRERGSFLSRATRQQTTAVAGYDLTFTPVKSVSALWALADREVARQVEEAHHAAVEATLRWLEREVLFTRRGRGGIQQVKARGLVAGMFTHRDARSSDPHLHTHVAVSNKVQDPDGHWLAVDGRVLYKANVTLSETYNTLLEAELIDRLGVRFEGRDRSGNKRMDKRSVREIVGLDQRLAQAWSKRHNTIEARRRELAAAFQLEHGRPPTVGEAVTLKEQAWEQTRLAKHAPRSEADQRAVWLAEATTILGSEPAVHDMVDTCLGQKPDAPKLTKEWITETAQRVVERVAEDRATWQIWHLRAEAQRHARAHGIRLAVLNTVVDRVVDTAITDHSLLVGGGSKDPDPLTDATTARGLGLTIPVPLQRTGHDPGRGPSGVETVSIYSLAGAKQYTSQAVLDAERRILEAAGRTGSRTIGGVRVGIAIAEAAANSDTTGLELNAAQQALVRELATSGRAVQLALAPAGTGKTTALAVLTHAWQDSGGTVIGLAPSAVAAQELGASINISNGEGNPAAPQRPWRPGRQHVHTDTLAKLVWHAQHADVQDHPPSWMQRIDHKTLVLLDEAGMAATTDLATVVDYITARGGQVRLIGDDRQLASVAAGGVLRDIAHQVGAVTLTEVHRFRNTDGSLNHAEAAATLALREGDPAAIAFYADRGRIHIGDLAACADQAYAAWATDRAAGDDSVLLAPTSELVAELNTRARHDRITGLTAAEVGPVLTLADGTSVSAGDRVITRHNDRRLRIANTDWVKNGDRWTVQRVNPDGFLSVVHDQLRRSITLPADYVATSVQLGYATTVHGAQGITTGTSHVVLTGEEDRNLLYVALSRGKLANHLYLAVAGDGDPHQLIRPEALIPPTAYDQLTQILGRDGTPVSATTTIREQTNPHRLLGDLADRYHDALTTAAEHLIGPTGMGRIDTHADELLSGLTDAPAWPTLRSHLALLALDDYNPLSLLTKAVALGSLVDARDPAAVLDARIDSLQTNRPEDENTPPLSRATAEGPLPWLPGIPARLADNLDWGLFLAGYHQSVREQTDTVRQVAQGWTGATAPAWAQSFVDADNRDMYSDSRADLCADLAVWRATTHIPDADLRPTGARTIGAPGAHQARLRRAVLEARPGYPFARRSWYQALPEAVRTDPWITPLCQRLARLERAGLPVTDYITRALKTDPTCPTSTATCTQTGESDANPSTTIGARPLPDEHQAAALWWRLVPHLGPAALAADQHTANLLHPTWTTTLAELVGTTKADYLQTTPAWPALVAAVDEGSHHHGWPPRDILAIGLVGIPHDGTLTGIEVADALVLRIAMLTDQPADQPDLHLPVDADDCLSPQLPADDPYLPPLPWHVEEVTSERAFLDPNQVPAERILELNEQALAYFASCYPRSWAPAYLGKRLGTDLTDLTDLTYLTDPETAWAGFAAGYAPGSGRSLMRHLTARGATLDELDQAGLVARRVRSDGTTYYFDVFRDRLVLPVRDPHDPTGQAILGFLGRRNPTKGDATYAGPKYVNSKTTPVFTKGEALFGYAESAHLLAHGALPVLVEGPIDALAITLASNGAAVGLAPMGTALTINQVKLLRAHIDPVNGRNQIAVATDADPAGWKAAQAAFWHLTAADLDPTLLDLPDGLDPATLFQTHGATAITAAIDKRVPLGEAMIDQLLRTAGHWSDRTVRQQIITHAAQIIGARGAETWLPEFERLRHRLHLSPGILEHQAISQSRDRDHNLTVYTQARLDELHDQPRLPRVRRDPQPTRHAPQRRGLAAILTPESPEPYVPPDRTHGPHLAGPTP